MSVPSPALRQNPGAAGQLDTGKPAISPELAARLGAELFGMQGTAQPLTGERDSNFLVQGGDGAACVLKFVNAAEPEVETRFQIEMLAHLGRRGGAVPVPEHRRTLAGADYTAVQDQAGLGCQVRAYTYLAGLPAVKAAPSAAHRRAVGRALGGFDAGLQDFRHEGLERNFLWNLMQLGELAPLVRHIGDGELRAIASEFIEAFEAGIAPALAGMRRQPIHNDLSKSNYLVDPQDHGRIAGILDFGDALYAPLICDPAIAASYQMQDAEDPLAAMYELLEGFAECITLTEEESRHMLDMTLARVVQRLVLTEWRAARFPENRAYILRHNADARRLAVLLAPLWRAGSRHARPSKTFAVS